MPGPGKQRSGKQGKYSKCYTCKSVHDGGVNERCPLASPHLIANYCSAKGIDYPTDLLKGRRTSRMSDPPVSAKGKRPVVKPAGKRASSTGRATKAGTQPPGPATQQDRENLAEADATLEAEDSALVNATDSLAPDTPTPTGNPPLLRQPANTPTSGVSTDDPVPGTSSGPATDRPGQRRISATVTRSQQPDAAGITLDGQLGPGRSFEELCSGVAAALQPKITDSLTTLISPLLQDPPANKPPAKKARLAQAPQLSDDEEDLIIGTADTEDFSQSQDASQIQGQDFNLPTDTSLLQLSQNLEKYFSSKRTDTPAAQGSARLNVSNDDARPPGQQSSNPPLGTATGLAEKWDDLAIVPFTVQPEHSIHKARKGRSAAGCTTALAWMQAAGLSQDESNDFLTKAQSRKSGETRKCIDYVVHEVNWPHEKVRRLMGAHADYQNLTFPEFMAGSLTIVSQGLPNTDVFKLNKGQLDYFTALALDANEHPWKLVQASHKEILICLEQGTLDLNSPADWKALRKETLLRLKNAPPAQASTGNNNNSADKNANAETGKLQLQVCKNYNLGRCGRNADHNKGNVRWTHICSFCFGKHGSKNAHPSLACELKKSESKKEPKNDKGGPKPQ